MRIYPLLFGCSCIVAGCATSYADYKPPEGYVYVSTSSIHGYRWYYAPASVETSILRGRDVFTNAVQNQTATTVSVLAISPNKYEQPWTSVEAFACFGNSGSYYKQAPDKRGWDSNTTTAAFGEARWHIWQKVCAPK
jgi:hypothetical protein